jgi:peptidoglycan/xylan/chitin deacetylase (PgdA/CDA1 family)
MAVQRGFEWISVWVRQAALITVLVGSVSVRILAGEPSGQVIPHRALWPDPISSAAEFDRASRAEILAFAHALAESEKLTDDALKDQLHVDGEIDIPSIQRLRRKLWKLLAGNYVTASASCVVHDAFCPTDPNPNDLRDEAEAFSSASIEPRYRPWFDDAAEFQRSYLDELLKLAAVFPRFNSEVETLNDNEFAGWGLRDRHFLLSFDDGPTRGPGYPEANAEDTDRTIEMVRGNRVNAVFFVMGETFQARLQESSASAMKALYSGLCVGDHGWVHKSHAIWPQWQDSIASTSSLIKETLPESYVPAFRPPYGQRPSDSGSFFRRLGLKVVLWNIDSRDWDDSLTADDVRQRVMSLMLLWRRGFILFHDVHPRARTAVPQLISWLAHDGITWTDCHVISDPGSDLTAAPSGPEKMHPGIDRFPLDAQRP